MSTSADMRDQRRQWRAELDRIQGEDGRGLSGQVDQQQRRVQDLADDLAAARAELATLVAKRLSESLERDRQVASLEAHLSDTASEQIAAALDYLDEMIREQMRNASPRVHRGPHSKWTGQPGPVIATDIRSRSRRLAASRAARTAVERLALKPLDEVELAEEIRKVLDAIPPVTVEPVEVA